jgi:hypothetical protein
VYRPVSTANGKQPLLKFDKIRLCCLFKTFTYELTFKNLLNFKLHNIKAKLCNINNTEWVNNLF